MFQGRATPWRAKSALSNYYNSQTFRYFGPLEPTLDLRLLQPPDLHHFLGNCPGRSQKFVAPHSEHAYFGTSSDHERGAMLARKSHVQPFQCP
jgi:hypothetical protein